MLNIRTGFGLYQTIVFKLSITRLEAFANKRLTQFRGRGCLRGDMPWRGEKTLCKATNLAERCEKNNVR
jgi:hypothetical protein